MNKQISKDKLEHYLSAVESAVRDSFPGNSGVVRGYNEIVRLALKGYDLEAASQPQADDRIMFEQFPVAQLGIR